MKTYDDLKKQVQDLMEKVEDKETLGKVGAVCQTIDELSEAHTKLQEDRDDIFKDYREMVKKQNFSQAQDPTQKDMGNKEEPKLEDFFK